MLIILSFQARSYPVRRRGERVKQRKMHARNCIQYYTAKCSAPSLLVIRLLQVLGYFMNAV
jgi:excinuclease UvrABC nuclease subunit